MTSDDRPGWPKDFETEVANEIRHAKGEHVTSDSEEGRLARVALSAHMPIVKWGDLRPGMRIHFNVGWAMTSWSGEVRSAPIDDEVVVIRRWFSRSRSARYVVIHRIEVDLWTKGRTAEPALLYVGPLPRGVIEGP